eukprot:NODE_4674_length_777_cov_1.881868_g3887_i0.p7 GENE.NODE_4674_length_777_cov_1.881868_g3887_i0~~NODE_4674_length_777_cov_1.881868_g3887_i0.p7  ORF type:complete len:56 (+),score=2.50 NODE_4674_length_777_cov_1.881868_g3887_i0:583-750(+)
MSATFFWMPSLCITDRTRKRRRPTTTLQLGGLRRRTESSARRGGRESNTWGASPA